MKQRIGISVLLIWSVLLQAQTPGAPCFSAFIEQGDQFLDQLKFDSARFSYMAAFRCEDLTTSPATDLYSYLDKVGHKMDWYMQERAIQLRYQQAQALQANSRFLEASEQYEGILQVLRQDSSFSVERQLILDQLTAIAEQQKAEAQYQQKVARFNSLMQLGDSLQSLGLAHFEEAFRIYYEAASIFKASNPLSERALLAQYELRNKVEFCFPSPCYRRYNDTKTFLHLATFDHIEYGVDAPERAESKIGFGIARADTYMPKKDEFTTIQEPFLRQYLRYYGPLSIAVALERQPDGFSMTLFSQEIIQGQVFQSSEEHYFGLSNPVGWLARLNYRLFYFSPVSLHFGSGIHYYAAELSNSTLNLPFSPSGEDFFDDLILIRIPFQITLQLELFQRIMPYSFISLEPSFYRLAYQGRGDLPDVSQRIWSQAVDFTPGIGLGTKFRVGKRQYLFMEISYLNLNNNAGNNQETSQFSLDFNDLSIGSAEINDNRLTFRFGYCYRFPKL